MWTVTMKDGRKAKCCFYMDVYRIYTEEYPGSYYWKDDMTFRTEEAARFYLNGLAALTQVK